MPAEPVLGGLVYYHPAGNLPVKRAFANVAASTTDGPVVAAVAGCGILVLSLAMLAAGTATAATFTSKPAGVGTAITPPWPNGANGGLVLPRNPDGWMQTNKGEGLALTTGAGSATAVTVTYLEVPLP